MSRDTISVHLSPSEAVFLAHSLQRAIDEHRGYCRPKGLDTETETVIYMEKLKNLLIEATRFHERPVQDAATEQVDPERFVSPAPPPSAHEREIAEILIEECAEIIQAASQLQQRATKLLRFGVQEIQPGQPDTNKRRLGLEFGDLTEIANRAVAAGLLDWKDVQDGRHHKRKQLAKYMQHPAS